MVRKWIGGGGGDEARRRKYVSQELEALSSKLLAGAVSTCMSFFCVRIATLFFFLIYFFFILTALCAFLRIRLFVSYCLPMLLSSLRDFDVLPGGRRLH